MAVDDLWYLSKKDPDGSRQPSARHGRGKRYRVRWTDPETGKPRSESFDKKGDADRRDANVRADISRGTYIDPGAGKITLREYSEQWMAQQIHADSTVDKVERTYRLHIWPLIGDVLMDRVRRGHVQSWVKDRSAEGVLAPSSLHVTYGYLRSMFKAAVIDRIIGVSPCQGIKLPVVPATDRYVPRPAEFHAVAACLPDYYRAAVAVAAGCGLRPQEVFGLELAHVDWLRREISVRQQVGQTAGRARFVGRLKTKTSRRIVDAPTWTLDELARLVETKPPRARRMMDRTDLQHPFERDVTLLFTTSTGVPVSRSNWSQVWRSALKRAGVTPGWGMHSLRHFFATSLIHRGASVKTVQLALGHAKPSITLDTYTHEWPDATERTRTLMDDALRIDGDETSGSTSAGS